ncbi:MAG: hypothetical protein ACI9VR_004184 [Cognaticolwellia sp.]|jgi:hypothetical protein
MQTRTKRLAMAAGGATLLGILLCGGGFVALNEPAPVGVSDAAADALADKMIDAVDREAWARTGAVNWTYADRYTHLWDRDRHFVQVQKGGWQALVDLNTLKGVASVDGVALAGAARDEAVQEAYAAWANDSFWLCAMNKAFDPGTSRSRVAQPDGSESLLVQYSSGGVTPGDAYLWHLDENGRPESWQMWVSILPIGGAAATWEGWEQLSTGAWVSTQHKLGPMDIQVTHLQGAESLSELSPGPDPFAPLLAL